jgi:single-stranded DNA-binding protein
MATLSLACALKVVLAGETTEEIVWHTIVGIGREGEYMRDNLVKGCLVYAEGILYSTKVPVHGKMVFITHIGATKVIAMRRPAQYQPVLSQQRTVVATSVKASSVLDDLQVPPELNVTQSLEEEIEGCPF